MQHSVGQTDPALARRQWTGLRDALAAHADIVLIEPQHRLPDMVFTANAGIVLGDVAVVSRFRSPERRGEEAFFRAWFETRGLRLAPWPQDVFFEGGGDVLPDRSQPILWCGFGFRSDQEAAALLGRLFGSHRAIGLRLVDPRFYHLDTCFCPLAGGYLLYFPPALDAASQRIVANAIAPEKRIAVEPEDALAFACNAVDLDGHIFLNAASPGLRKRLHEAGFTTVITPLSEFHKSGGTAKCLTLKLNE